jgi:hypothetical protein
MNSNLIKLLAIGFLGLLIISLTTYSITNIIPKGSLKLTEESSLAVNYFPINSAASNEMYCVQELNILDLNEKSIISCFHYNHDLKFKFNYTSSIIYTENHSIRLLSVFQNYVVLVKIDETEYTNAVYLVNDNETKVLPLGLIGRTKAIDAFFFDSNLLVFYIDELFITNFHVHVFDNKLQKISHLEGSVQPSDITLLKPALVGDEVIFGYSKNSIYHFYNYSIGINEFSEKIEININSIPTLLGLKAYMITSIGVLYFFQTFDSTTIEIWTKDELFHIWEDTKDVHFITSPRTVGIGGFEINNEFYFALGQEAFTDISNITGLYKLNFDTKAIHRILETTGETTIPYYQGSKVFFWEFLSFDNIKLQTFSLLFDNYYKFHQIHSFLKYFPQLILFTLIYGLYMSKKQKQLEEPKIIEEYPEHN